MPDSRTPARARLALRRTITIAAAAAAAVLATAPPALAHITISPGSAVAATENVFTVRVPGELPDANTTRVDLYFPASPPIADALPQPVPGWHVAITRVHLAKPVRTDDGPVSSAVSVISWTGGKIVPGEFQEFPIEMGPMPPGTLYFKALQTYTGPGRRTIIVRWIDLPTGGIEPAHPAPSITVTPARSVRLTAARAAAVADGGSGGDAAATGLAIAGLVAGLAGLGAGATALRKTRPARS